MSRRMKGVGKQVSGVVLTVGDDVAAARKVTSVQ